MSKRFNKYVYSRIDLRQAEEEDFLPYISLKRREIQTLLESSDPDEVLKTKRWQRLSASKRFIKFAKMLNQETAVLFWKDQTELRILAQTALTENLKSEVEQNYLDRNLRFKRPINPSTNISEVKCELERRNRLRNQKIEFLKQTKKLVFPSESLYLKGLSSINLELLLNTKAAQYRIFYREKLNAAKIVYAKLFREYLSLKKQKRYKVLERWHSSWNGKVPTTAAAWLKTKQGQR